MNENRIQNRASRAQRRRNHRWNMKMTVMIASILMLFVLVIGGTIAYLTSSSGSITNTFKPSEVTTEITEKFDGEKKTDVNVKNTGNIDAYIRVKLVTYRVNSNGQHIGGTATLPEFVLGNNWKEHDGYYYYLLPVAPGEKPATNLTDEMILHGTYTDADGGVQVIEVMAEGIQSQPDQAVQDAWGITVKDGKLDIQ